jgi:hypothetical protein
MLWKGCPKQSVPMLLISHRSNSKPSLILAVAMHAHCSDELDGATKPQEL